MGCMCVPLALRLRLAVAVAGALVAVSPAAARAAGDAGTPDALGSARAVRALAPAEADRALAVHVAAVVTFVAETRAFLFVQDATDGIFVDGGGRSIAGARVGDAVVVDGVSAAGLYAPQIRLDHLTVLGPRALPAARPATYAELASGKLDSQLVELDGVVRSVEREPPRADGQLRLIFELASGGAVFQVRLALADPARAGELEGQRLIDATIRVRGVCGGIFNGQRQLIGVVLHAADASNVTVLEPPPAADPFQEPARAIESLFRFERGAHGGRRVRVDGVVTYYRPGEALYVWDGASGLLVQTSQRGALGPGDRVAVVGFPAMGAWSPVLEDASFRRTGAGPAPPALPTTAEAEATEAAHDGRLVTVEAELLEAVAHGGRLVLALRAASALFDAELAELAELVEPAGPAPAGLERGSRLALTGIAVARVDPLRKRPAGFKLLLRGPGDVVVRSRPPWWNLGRLLRLLALLGGVFALALIWVVILRRRVCDQTEIIRAQLQHEAALEERYRGLFENANDVVFSLDADGRLLAINRAAEEITGYRRAELLAGALTDFMPPERREPARRLFADLAAGGEAPPVFETALVARDGRVVPLEMTVRLTLQGGRPAGVEGIARDVSARKRAETELRAAHLRLIDVSHQAGMAEVASSVLHNVGNVLNSVNVSAALLADQLRASRADNIARAAALLREHEADLGELAARDPQGRQLVAYLAGAGEHLAAEQRALLDEVEALRASVDHIKEIVATQQGYARAPGGVVETLPASALVAEALRIHAEPLARQGIELSRDIAADPPVTVEKHKVLQILVNLIGNARHACQGGGSDGAPGRIAVRVEARGRGRVRFVVSDDGAGIAPENLTRIFQHGFTTRSEGHGFGLHSAALTARELGGSLSAASDGSGCGATFTLEIPTDPSLRPKHTTRERLEIVTGRA
jgi:PAS domain S-box-containing protein